MTSALRLLDLAQRSAVVTGSSTGIGKAVATALANQGCRVYGFDLAPPDDVARVHRNGSGTISHVRCDVGNANEIDAAVQVVKHESSSLDFLVNVAGVDPKFTLQDGDEFAWSRIMDVNLRGYYLMIRACAELLDGGAGRAIVNVSSVSAYLGVRRRSIYAASKAGIIGLTTGLARELGDRGIRINSVSPGWVHTDRQVAEYFRGEAGAANAAYLDTVQSLQGKRISPDDVAAPILFLLSGASNAITGSNLMVDAGWRLQ